MSDCWFRWQGEDLLLYCHLQPGAGGDAFAGVHGERLKIRVGAPPVQGRANSRLVAFLAARFAVAKARICIEWGTAGRHKTVRVKAPRQLPEELGLQAP